VAKSITQAADEILSGQWREQFVADTFQFGSGVSIIANVDEVLANRATQLLGGALGTYEFVHPQQHVALGHRALTFSPRHARRTVAVLARARAGFARPRTTLAKKIARIRKKVAKVGRAHLQDSAPITLGQEFTPSDHP